MKRSVSLNTDPESPAKKRKFLGLGLFSTLKRVFSKPESQQSSALSENGHTFADFRPDELPADFTSQKRRMSVQENLHNRNIAVPRTSNVGINGYQALTNSLAAERQITNGGLEHSRAEVFSPIGEFGNPAPLAHYSGLVKDTSPTSDIFPRNQVLPANPLDMELDGGNGELPIVIEHEFAPLYKDEEGNLVRPPFINLDPRERYHLLQLKKSMEASEFLQNRLKYMVDPDETTSIIRPDNKVDSATQTRDKDYLDHSLKFTNLRTKLALRNRRNRRSNTRGVISGLFYYEPTKKEVEGSTEEELTGYLGKLSKPKFNTPAAKLSEKGFADDASSDFVSSRRKSVGQRAGLDESIRLGKTQDGSVDKDYLEKTERISNIIKLKDHPAPAKKTLGPSSGFNFDVDLNAISSILQKRKDDDELVTKSLSADNKPAAEISASLFSKPEDAKPAEAKESAPKFSFGAKEPASKISFGPTESTPKISFGGKESTSKFSFGAKESAPKVSFGSGEPATKISFGDAKESAPKFSFGNESTPSISLGKESTPTSVGSKETLEAASEEAPEPKRKRIIDDDKPSISFGTKPAASSSGLFGAGTETKTELPKFSFGAKTNDTSAPTPAFSLDSSAKTGLFSSKAKEGVTSGTTGGLFGDKPAASESFSFGEKKDESAESSKSESLGQNEQKDDAPKFSFGQTTEAPKFLFGEKKDNSSSSAVAPKFSFGAKTTENKLASEPPALALGGGSTETPKFSFETLKPDEASKSQTQATPKFSFGQTKPAETPKVVFGQTKPEETPKFSFGKSADNSAAKPAEPKFLFGLEQKPASSTSGIFGKSDTKEPTPAFSFSSKETTPKPSAGNVVSGFSFGATGQPAQAAPASTPAFSFGQSALVDPALIFGASANAPQPAFNFSVSKESTPFKFGAAAAAPAKPDGFSFSNNVTAGFGASRSVTPSGFGFTNGPNPNIAAPAPQFGGFNGGASVPGFNTAPGGAPGAFGANPNAGQDFGQNNGGFSFTPSAMGAATGFNSAPGSFGVGSRENTPPVGFGQPGSAPGQPFTPPLAMQGRKFAQMRPRKRF